MLCNAVELRFWLLWESGRWKSEVVLNYRVQSLFHFPPYFPTLPSKCQFYAIKQYNRRNRQPVTIRFVKIGSYQR